MSTDQYMDQTTLLLARWLLPVDGLPVKDAALVINNGAIMCVCPRRELSDRLAPKLNRSLLNAAVDYGNAVIMPGLINLHTHLDYSLMQALNEDTPLFSWIAKLVERSLDFNDEDWRKSALYGCRQAALAGTSCVVENTRTGLSAEAIASTGLRGVVGLEIFGLSEASVEASWSKWQKKYTALKNNPALQKALAEKRIILTIAPHAPYTVHPALWQKARDWSIAESLPLLAHLAESQQEWQWIHSGNKEVDEYLSFVQRILSGSQAKTGIAPSHAQKRKRPKNPGFSDVLKEESDERRPVSISGFSPDETLSWRTYGLTPVEHLKRHDLLNEFLIAAHAVHVDHSDLQLLSEHNVKVAHCPRSNTRLSNGSAPLEKMQALGMTFGFGTDSLASCDDLNLLNEARAAIAMHKAINPRFQLSSSDVIKSLTLDAARAIKLDHAIGSLTEGKRADIAIFSLPSTTINKTVDPADQLLHPGTQLLDLFVDGHKVVSAGKQVKIGPPI